MALGLAVGLGSDATAQAPAGSLQSPDLNLKRDYDAEQAAVSAPRPEPLHPFDDVQSLKKAQQARAAHLAGNLPQALKLALQANSYNGKMSFVNADAYFTLGRIFEALHRRSDADQAYRAALSSAGQEPVTLRLCREGLARVATPPAVSRAEALEKKGDFAGTVQAYEEALRQWPDDAPLLSELAWAAVRAGDGPKAQAAAARSVSLASSPEIKAAAYYNLGRAAELLQDRESAISAYQSSVALRQWVSPSQTPSNARRQLRAAAGALQKLGAPLFAAVAKVLAGPYPSLTAAGLDSDGSALQPKRSTLLAPFTGVEAWTRDDSYALKVATKDGFFLLENFLERENRADYDIPAVWVEGGRLLVQSTLTTGRFDTVTSSYLTVCGVAARHAACVGPIELKRVYTGYVGGKLDGHSLAPKTEFEYKARLLAEDVLTIEPMSVRNDMDLTGRFKLRFP